ncbi:sulfatase-like hydrolase/transferase [Shigella flexneri]
MKQAGYKTFWITKPADDDRPQYHADGILANRQAVLHGTSNVASAREYDADVLKLHFQDMLNNPAPKKQWFICWVTRIKYDARLPENQGKFDGNTDHAPGLSAEELESYNDYDNANLYNDHVVASLIKALKRQPGTDHRLLSLDHGKDLRPPHEAGA